MTHLYRIARSLRRWLVIASALAVLVVACGGGEKQASAPKDWQKVSAAGVELALPPSFVGGAPGSAEMDKATVRLKALGQLGLAQTLSTLSPNEALQYIDSDGTAAMTLFVSTTYDGFKLADYDIFASLNPEASKMRLL